jgi:hypothetical protein
LVGADCVWTDRVDAPCHKKVWGAGGEGNGDWDGEGKGSG